MELESRDGEWCVWFDGDLAYHGPPAEPGAGTPAPCLPTPTAGWSIHA
jgi:hypothetical protein